MKLRDWYNFNYKNESFKCNFGDFYVKVLRNESYTKDNIIIAQTMKPDDMINIFGDYKLIVINKMVRDYESLICVCICKEV